MTDFEWFISLEKSAQTIVLRMIDDFRKMEISDAKAIKLIRSLLKR